MCMHQLHKRRKLTCRQNGTNQQRMFVQYRSLGSIWFQWTHIKLLELIVALRYEATGSTIDVLLWRSACLCLCGFLLQQCFVLDKTSVSLCVCATAYLCWSRCVKALAKSESLSKCFFLRKSWATASIRPRSSSGCLHSKTDRPSASTSCSERPQSRPISRPLWRVQTHKENNTQALIGHYDKGQYG